MKKKPEINDFSSHLFWDVDKNTLDMDIHAGYIIKRVLEYGKLKDWDLIRDYYSLPVITEKTKKLRSLEERALSYISAISHTPITQFRCYTLRQLMPPHWNF